MKAKELAMVLSKLTKSVIGQQQRKEAINTILIALQDMSTHDVVDRKTQRFIYKLQKHYTRLNDEPPLCANQLKQDEPTDKSKKSEIP